jgi:hypothetical protein
MRIGFAHVLFAPVLCSAVSLFSSICHITTGSVFTLSDVKNERCVQMQTYAFYVIAFLPYCQTHNKRNDGAEGRARRGRVWSAHLLACGVRTCLCLLLLLLLLFVFSLALIAMFAQVSRQPG